MTVPLGKALSLSDEDLDGLAEITDEDIRKTNIRWSAVVKNWAKNLLLASLEE